MSNGSGTRSADYARMFADLTFVEIDLHNVLLVIQFPEIDQLV